MREDRVAGGKETTYRMGSGAGRGRTTYRRGRTTYRRGSGAGSCAAYGRHNFPSLNDAIVKTG